MDPLIPDPNTAGFSAAFWHQHVHNMSPGQLDVASELGGRIQSDLQAAM
jgi:hypothetical protein